MGQGYRFSVKALLAATAAVALLCWFVESSHLLVKYRACRWFSAPKGYTGQDCWCAISVRYSRHRIMGWGGLPEPKIVFQSGSCFLSGDGCNAPAHIITFDSANVISAGWQEVFTGSFKSAPGWRDADYRGPWKTEWGDPEAVLTEFVNDPSVNNWSIDELRAWIAKKNGQSK